MAERIINDLELIIDHEGEWQQLLWGGAPIMDKHKITASDILVWFEKMGFIKKLKITHKE